MKLLLIKPFKTIQKGDDSAFIRQSVDLLWYFESRARIDRNSRAIATKNQDLSKQGTFYHFYRVLHFQVFWSKIITFEISRFQRHHRY